ncbi:tyrosine-type recombinase/integrase [Reyranella sp.]|uniref:tyrosine-type recombinase/integrase n=1 Tax=Reyranella sp. TaxID=1929291 RepID=UPI0027310D16|nr:tyrosine-type recombinase/integrase [Reyranella sp.]MDP2377326.1 tyrosine-type recombinase/integrase [Reyranella sp.]
MNEHDTPVRRRRLLDAGQHLPLLDDYGRLLAGTGFSSASVHIHLGSALHFLAWLVQSGIALEEMGPDIVARFAAHDCRCHSSPRRVGQHYINRVDRFVRHLAARGVLPPRPVAEAPAVDRNVADWLDAQDRQRGLAKVTIVRHGRMLAQILPFIGTDPSRYTARIIRDGLLEHAQTARSVHYPKMVASALRLYLRHLAHRGLAAPDLDRAVPTAKSWRLASLPRYLEPDAVERLIASCDPETPGGRRDRAILLLLARLGLRARDVAELRLADIDWRAATIAVCGKGRREVRLPLPQDAGDALIAWLTGPRPAASGDTVFARLLPPFDPVSSGVVGGVVRRAVERAGVENAPSRGSHLLRHSAATAMLRGGATLDAIATVLRHRSTDTTAHYAKVDVAMLGDVAQAWPADGPTNAAPPSTPPLGLAWPEGAPC